MLPRLRAGTASVLAACLLVSVAALVGAAPAGAANAAFTQTYGVVADENLGIWRTDRYGSQHNEFSSPAVGDVTGDGQLDVVTSAPNGKLYIYRASDGAREGSIFVGAGIIVSSPTLVDLDNDPQHKLDILVGLMPTNEGDGSQITVGGYDNFGNRIFAKRTCDYPGKPCNVFSTVAVGDVDGDGQDDIVATSQDHYLHAWHKNGTNVAGFPVLVYDTTWSSPSIADLDGDGRNEIVTITDVDTMVCAGNPGACPSGEWGSIIRVVDGSGHITRSHMIHGEITVSSPAVGDITGDGLPEIAFTSGSCFRFTSPDSGCGTANVGSGGAERKFHVLDRNLNVVYERDLYNSSMTSPAIVKTGSGGRVAVTDDEGWLYEFDAAGNWVFTPVCGLNNTGACRKNIYGNSQNLGTSVSPVSADVDNDGTPEIVYNGESALRVFDSNNGAVEYAFQMWGNPYRMGNQVSTPTVFSMGGKARIAYHVIADYNQNANFRDGGDRDGLYLWTGTTDLGAATAWPSFRGNATDRRGSVVIPIDYPNTPEGRYISKAYLDLLGRPVDASGLKFWYGVVKGQGRAAFASQLVYLSPSCEWSKKVVRDLYNDILGRDPDASGLNFWSGEICSKRRLARDVAALIYGSDEYFNDPAQGNGNNADYVDELYHDILQRAADQGGRDYWVGQIQQTDRPAVAYRFYQSQESRERRVRNQYQFLLGRQPDAGGLAFWANRLVQQDDLVLTIDLVSSDEYFNTP